ncbi:uncharacterized protein ACLA_094420 [Aspergillus clavatus NRRL 1]|uniref:F-box domain protein n=1 Tax=Aspergillus clavatus (strain ATCC 1007 / CBS 513.65 / DSM 816 / NCTC 3887 / NRRL 1 / QM 1276 / 107) TaxID=344612 RepID=A1CFU3_ASPCL|nr:uncharacterized protein ACLA_094420 [Aspergillus clavatus NRRL 1]EAW11742.1 conserved hypothetical protein [Aspergillus clavatus NRRL 1]
MDCPDPDEETFFALSESLRMTKSAVGSPGDSGFESSATEPDVGSNNMDDLMKTGPTTLLHLPQSVKIRILEYIGLVRPCLINITEEGSRVKQATHGTCGVRNAVQTRGNWVTHADRLCDHPRLPTQVLMASREFREDLGALFFAHNRFSVVLSNKTDWNNFFEAVDWAAEDVRYLHVELRTWDNRFIKPGGQRMLLKLWTRFCKYLQEQMVNLRYFSLKCRVKDFEVALKIMCAMDSFPVLFQCAFHFSHTVEDDIRPLAKRNALRLTGNLGAKPFFPYFNLPKEVQLMILETLLASQLDPFLPSSGREPGDVTFVYRKTMRVTESNPLTCCGTCSPLQALCFCFARQTAYSTSCSCFSSPVRYFLVNRAFYEDARRIFFSRNRFFFVEEDPDIMMRFMNCIPTASFMMIRRLVFKFPKLYRHPWRTAYKIYEASTLASWSVLRRFIREHFDVSRLSLMIVDLGVKHHWSRPGFIRTNYIRRLLKTFEDLRGLRDFRVFLMEDRIFELDAERIVMGSAVERGPRDTEFPFAGN